ncbi:MAG: biopolymer transporter ExbD [Bacteroidales bacterium]|nr:biopolymer transporter ExbD [Bacteroidales bacterium]
MAIKSRHTKKLEPNMSSMSDLVFLLLIFFVITSTLVSPNMIRVDLPSSDAGQQNVKRNLEVYVDSLHVFHVNPENPQDPGTTSLDTLGAQLRVAMFDMDQEKPEQRVVILRADRDVPVQCMVDMMGVVATLNKEREAANPPKPKYSMAMATVYSSN